jgi:uncharacterized protein YdeI (YjbR/CyaY-like superfamily)
MRFEDAEALDSWLETNHSESDGIWIQIAKSGSGHASVNWANAVPVVLCHGWIDGQARRLDDEWYLQRFTPRRPRSNWSQINVAHVERLIEEGKMRPWGMLPVAQAKADGRWEAAYAPASAREIPDELQSALDASPKAAAAFAELDSQTRYAIVYRIQSGKRQETRDRNTAKFVAMLERGETPG